MQSIRQMNRMFDDLHQTFVEPIRDNQLVRLIFNHDMFNWAVNTNLVKKEKLTAEYMKYLFEEQVQSYRETPVHEIKQNHILTVNIVVADVNIGGAEQEDDGVY